MSLTGDKICGVCGRSVSTIGALYYEAEMRDNNYLCGECMKRCSPNLSLKAVRGWTRDDALAHMEYMQNLQTWLQHSFRCSATVQGIPGSNDPVLLAADDSCGMWYSPIAPDAFSFDHVVSWRLSLSYNPDGGFHQVNITPPRPDMPVPGKTEEVDGMSIIVTLKNHPYAEEVEIPILGTKSFLETYKSYLNGGYQIAEACYRFFEDRCIKATGKIEFY